MVCVPKAVEELIFSLAAVPEVVIVRCIVILWGLLKVFKVVGECVIWGIAIMLIIVVTLLLVNHFIKLIFIEQFIMVLAIIKFTTQCLRPEPWRRPSLSPRLNAYLLLLLRRMLMILMVEV